jgi:hypothetical protein
VQRWEYRILTVDRGELPNIADATLRDLGQNGWELVSTVGRERHGHSHEFFLFFKRAVAEKG